MKKSFTLLELLIVIFSITIVVGFSSKTVSNIVKEVTIQKSNLYLNSYSFRIMEILTKGVMVDNNYIAGLITLNDNLNYSNNYFQFNSHYYNNVIEYEIEDEKLILRSSNGASFEFDFLKTDNFDIKIEGLDIQEIRTNLYRINLTLSHFNTNSNYSRLVYVD